AKAGESPALHRVLRGTGLRDRRCRADAARGDPGPHETDLDRRRPASLPDRRRALVRLRPAPVGPPPARGTPRAPRLRWPVRGRRAPAPDRPPAAAAVVAGRPGRWPARPGRRPRVPPRADRTDPPRKPGRPDRAVVGRSTGTGRGAPFADLPDHDLRDHRPPRSQTSEIDFVDPAGTPFVDPAGT